MRKSLFQIPVLILCLTCSGCIREFEPVEPPKPTSTSNPDDDDLVNGTAEIDLSNWKVTLPIGPPTEVLPPDILDYANIEVLKPYMFDDTSDRSLVFYTEPGSTTTNSSYSRTELREQMVPGSNSTNWTFAQGGMMKGTLKVSDISQFQNGDYHRVIVMQIHGRLTNEQRDLIGASDNNAPPVLKIYWDEGRVNVRRKVLKDLNVSATEKLRTDAWEDESHYFQKQVDFEPFTIEIRVEEGKMYVALDEGEEEITFEDIHVQEWGIFENYFKAGNYLISTTPGAHSTVKYYDLTVSH